MNDALFYSKFIYKHYDIDYNHTFYNTFHYTTEEELNNFKLKLINDRRREHIVEQKLKKINKQI